MALGGVLATFLVLSVLSSGPGERIVAAPLAAGLAIAPSSTTEHSDDAPAVDHVPVRSRHGAAIAPSNLTSGCRRFLRWAASDLFPLSRINGPKLSVEQKVVKTFMPAFSTACKALGVGGGKATSVAIVDIGANDGEDIPSWFDVFGRRSCARGQAHFLLFEPQQRYKETLEKLVGTVTGGKDALPVVFRPAGVGPDKMHGETLQMVGEGQQGMVNIDGRKGIKLSKTHKERNVKSAVVLESLRVTLEKEGLATAPILFLKVDCEGADASILMASEPVFAAQRVQFAVFELNGNVKHFSTNYVQAVAMMNRHGYRTYLAGFNAKRQWILLEADAGVISQWRPKLETMIAVSKDFAEQHLHGEAGPFGAVAGRRLTGADLTQATRNQLGDCIGMPPVYLLPCPDCDANSV
jgi:FkbM family methyltransferase